MAVFDKYRTDLAQPAPEGTKKVTVQIQAFTWERE
jgi:hypothetical protein